jgi:hypothetical protein
MAIAIFKIIALFCFLILPMIGPSKRKNVKYKQPFKTTISTNYAVNKHGEIEELTNKEGKKEDY